MALEFQQNWNELLHRALTVPGIAARGYRAFHGYSFRNQMLALIQCEHRGISPGPIASFMAWKDRGRSVRKGEKAIVLCRPCTTKKAAEPGQDAETRTFFVFKPHWFVLSQTDGPELEPEPLQGWDETAALKALDVEKVEFTMTNGNAQGYAIKRKVAINPLDGDYWRTLFHELGHVVLGHTANADPLGIGGVPQSVEEFEAESVALLCCASLGLDGEERSRGYIQSYYQGTRPPEGSAGRIFKAVDAILKAGEPATAEVTE